jgi:hypothetical protein
VTDIAGNKSWIKHRENGNLVPTDDYNALAEELIWSFETKRIESIVNNRKSLNKKANYKINMKIISNKYHNLTLLSLIKNVMLELTEIFHLQSQKMSWYDLLKMH